MAGNYPNLPTGINLQVWKAQWTQNRVIPKKSTPRHIITELLKTENKFKIFENSQRKTMHCIQIDTKRSWVSHQKSRRPENRETTFLKAEKRSCQSRILYPIKIHLKNESKIKTFSNGAKLRQSVASRPALKEMLQGVILLEGKWSHKENWNFEKEERVTDFRYLIFSICMAVESKIGNIVRKGFHPHWCVCENYKAKRREHENSVSDVFEICTFYCI